MAAADIVFFKQPGTRYHSVLDRTDGVRVRLEGGSWNKVGGSAGRVPHDIAHLLVEEAFGLDRGLWGVLAAGGTVQNASVIAGRQPPHAAARAEAIVAPARAMLQQAEVLVRAVADAALEARPRDLSAFRAACGERWWVDGLTADELEHTCQALQHAGEEWAQVTEGGQHHRRWVEPHRRAHGPRPPRG